MSTIASIFAVLIVVLILLVIGNLVFSFIAERRNPPVGKFIECDGVRVHYREWGDAMAPCVVLFHGNGTMIQDFAISGLVDLLARRNRVLCFDRPGFGYTQRPRSRIWTPSAQAALFVKALEQIGARDPVVVGHSWGTLVAVALGLRGSGSLNRLQAGGELLIQPIANSMSARVKASGADAPSRAHLHGEEAPPRSPRVAKSKADLTQRATLRQTQYTSLISLP
jgi:pimeloyl-ACP methyl ester carboxylesterase